MYAGAQDPGDDWVILQAALPHLKPLASIDMQLNLDNFEMCAGFVGVLHEVVAMGWKSVSLSEVSATCKTHIHTP